MSISTVGPAPAPTTSGSSPTTGNTGDADSFADILSAGTPVASGSSKEGTGDAATGDVPQQPADCQDAEQGPAAADVLSAAQIMIAAQVVPVAPVLALALAGQAGAPASQGAAGAVAPGPTTVPSGLPGDVATGQASALVDPSGAVPLATPAGTPAATGAEAPAPTSTGPASAQASAPVDVPAAPLDAPGTAQATGLAAADAQTAQQDPAAPGVGSETGSIPTDALTAAALSAPKGDATQHHGEQKHREDQPGSGSATASAAPLTGTPAAAPLPTIGARHAVEAGQVTGQVFPEIGRLVARGDGTRRITLKLSPEALGDVSVTLTVRNGEVHVRMIGSDLAQQALRAGAPDLQRLLESAGASSSQVVVGDRDASLFSGMQNPNGSAPGDTDHRAAGTRHGDTSAMDGATGRSHPRSPLDPTAIRGALARTRSGVDVTM